MSRMFKTFLESIPRNRAEMVSELDKPDDIVLSPYLMSDIEDSIVTARSNDLSDSLGSLSINMDEEIPEKGTLSTDSSLALSRAMTDSEIDYGRFRKLKARRLSDPWGDMMTALDHFPPGYLSSLNSFISRSDSLASTDSYVRSPRHSDFLREKMQRYFDEQCRVFSPEDPALETLEEALIDLGYKSREDFYDEVITTVPV